MLAFSLRIWFSTRAIFNIENPELPENHIPVRRLIARFYGQKHEAVRGKKTYMPRKRTLRVLKLLEPEQELCEKGRAIEDSDVLIAIDVVMAGIS